MVGAYTYNVIFMIFFNNCPAKQVLKFLLRLKKCSRDRCLEKNCSSTERTVLVGHVLKDIFGLHDCSQHHTARKYTLSHIAVILLITC
jgi:hypothetical protein